MKKRGSLFEERNRLQEPKYTRSAPVTPCDSETSTWSDKTWGNVKHYDSGSEKASYEESADGVWWWRRPLDVRRTQCRRCGASSSTRPLRMMPCAGIAQDDVEPSGSRPLMSRDRPLLFVRQIFL